MKVVVFSVVFLGFAGSFGFDDELSQNEHYCDMVESGHWRDYDNLIECN